MLDNKNSNLQSSVDNFQTQEEISSNLLPRSAWTSKLGYLRVILKAKLALDRIEKEAND